jgi:hypothetical protein
MNISLLTSKLDRVLEKLIVYGETIFFIRLYISSVEILRKIFGLSESLAIIELIDVFDGDTVTWFWIGSHGD